MAAGGPKQRIALGANLLLDLAQEQVFAHRFRESLQAAIYTLLVPPTIVLELAFASQNGAGPERELARRALAQMLEWGLQPFILTPGEQAIAQEFARDVRQAGLLPAMELNDALLLAETALAGIPFLVTSDYHLVDIDRDALMFALAGYGLPSVQPIHPNRLLRLLQ